MKFLFDIFPVLLFFFVFKLYDIYVATGALIIASVAQVGWVWWRHRKVERMPLITALVAVILGGVTFALQDEIYIKWKPTVVNWLFAVVFLGSQFIGQRTILERLMGDNLQLPRAIWSRLTWAWSMFFCMLGILNLYVAFRFDTDTWVNFKLFGMLGLTLAFVVAQAFYIARYLPADAQPKE